MTRERLQRSFRERWGVEPKVLRAPGRVNLIGEHTDYHEGLVLPVAIDRWCYVAFAADDESLHVASMDAEETRRLGGSISQAEPRGDWTDYAVGVARELSRGGIPCRGRLLFASEVPLGAGLSSSAALEVAAGRALASLAGIDIEALELAALCQRAECDFVGAPCGIMDQCAASMARQGQALLLDCRSLAITHTPLPPSCAIVVANSMVRHSVAGTGYAERRAQCTSALDKIRALRSDVTALRDLGVGDVADLRAVLDPLEHRRVAHVLYENQRVGDFAEALERGDRGVIGSLMAASHASLRDDYEVSCPEIDELVRLAIAIDGCVGARMTGAGFGGCTVNLVEQDAAPSFVADLSDRYQAAAGYRPDVVLCASASGAFEK